jgi:hypothetical protein
MNWLGWIFLSVFGGIGLVILVASALGGLRRAFSGQPLGALVISSPALLLGAIFLLAGVGAFLLITQGLKFARPVDAFAAALKRDDYLAAWEQCNGRLQGEFDGFSGFAAWAKPLQVKRLTVFSACSNLEDGRADGQGRFESGERFSITLYTTRGDETWKIEGIRIWADSLEGTRYFVGTSNGMDCSD